MHWIGIGFLIAVGFALASVAIPFGFALLAIAWEMRKGIAIVAGVILGIIILAALWSEPSNQPWIFWGAVIIIGRFIYLANKKSGENKKTLDVHIKDTKNSSLNN